jgi:hypothetical protein
MQAANRANPKASRSKWNIPTDHRLLPSTWHLRLILQRENGFHVLCVPSVPNVNGRYWLSDDGISPGTRRSSKPGVAKAALMPNPTEPEEPWRMGPMFE